MQKIDILLNFLNKELYKRHYNYLLKIAGRKHYNLVMEDLGLPSHRGEKRLDEALEEMASAYRVDKADLDLIDSGFLDRVKSIKDAKLPEELSRFFSRRENAFILLGNSFSENPADFRDILEYMRHPKISGALGKGLRRAYISYTGGSIRHLLGISESIDLTNKDVVFKTYARFMKIVREFLLSQQNGLGSYKTKNIVYIFKNGYTMVTIPGKGEMEPWPNKPNSSYDRIVEGNKQGLCLGEKLCYHHDPKTSVYSLRDEKNEPLLTITAANKELLEVRGKNNNPPNIKAAEMFVEFLENTDLIVNWKNNATYRSLPPLDIGVARNHFLKDKEAFLKKGYPNHWYGQGISDLDNYIDHLIQTGDCQVLYSGLAERYRDKFYEVAKKCAEEYSLAISNRDNKFSTIVEDKQGAFFYVPDINNIHFTWKVYRKEEWAQDAVKKLLEYKPDHYFGLEMFRIDEYRDFGADHISNFLNKMIKGIVQRTNNTELASIINLTGSYYELEKEVVLGAAKLMGEDEFVDKIDQAGKYYEKFNLKIPLMNPLRYFNEYHYRESPEYIKEKLLAFKKFVGYGNIEDSLKSFFQIDFKNLINFLKEKEKEEIFNFLLKTFKRKLNIINVDNFIKENVIRHINDLDIGSLIWDYVQNSRTYTDVQDKSNSPEYKNIFVKLFDTDLWKDYPKLFLENIIYRLSATFIYGEKLVNRDKYLYEHLDGAVDQDFFRSKLFELAERSNMNCTFFKLGLHKRLLKRYNKIVMLAISNSNDECFFKYKLYKLIESMNLSEETYSVGGNYYFEDTNEGVRKREAEGDVNFILSKDMMNERLKGFLDPFTFINYNYHDNEMQTFDILANIDHKYLKQHSHSLKKIFEKDLESYLDYQSKFPFIKIEEGLEEIYHKKIFKYFHFELQTCGDAVPDIANKRDSEIFEEKARDIADFGSNKINQQYMIWRSYKKFHSFFLKYEIEDFIKYKETLKAINAGKSEAEIPQESYLKYKEMDDKISFLFGEYSLFQDEYLLGDAQKYSNHYRKIPLLNNIEYPEDTLYSMLSKIRDKDPMEFVVELASTESIEEGNFLLYDIKNGDFNFISDNNEDINHEVFNNYDMKGHLIDHLNGFFKISNTYDNLSIVEVKNALEELVADSGEYGEAQLGHDDHLKTTDKMVFIKSFLRHIKNVHTSISKDFRDDSDLFFKQFHTEKGIQYLDVYLKLDNEYSGNNNSNKTILDMIGEYHLPDPIEFDKHREKVRWGEKESFYDRFMSFAENISDLNFLSSSFADLLSELDDDYQRRFIDYILKPIKDTEYNVDNLKIDKIISKNRATNLLEYLLDLSVNLSISENNKKYFIEKILESSSMDIFIESIVPNYFNKSVSGNLTGYVNKEWVQKYYTDSLIKLILKEGGKGHYDSWHSLYLEYLDVFQVDSPFDLSEKDLKNIIDLSFGFADDGFEYSEIAEEFGLKPSEVFKSVPSESKEEFLEEMDVDHYFLNNFDIETGFEYQKALINKINYHLENIEGDHAKTIFTSKIKDVYIHYLYRDIIPDYISEKIDKLDPKEYFELELDDYEDDIYRDLLEEKLKKISYNDYFNMDLNDKWGSAFPEVLIQHTENKKSEDLEREYTPREDEDEGDSDKEYETLDYERSKEIPIGEDIEKYYEDDGQILKGSSKNFVIKKLRKGRIKSLFKKYKEYGDSL